MKAKSIDYKKVNTVYKERRFRTNKNQTLRELQLTLINSLAKSPIVNLTKKRKQNNDDFDNYISKMDISLHKYQLSYTSKDEVSDNEIGPNEKYMTKEDTKLIKKIYNKNKLYSTKGLSSKNEESNLKVVVTEKQDYPNPYQSLGIIKHNNHIFNEISKDFLYRQSDLFNKQIINIQKYEKKYKIKMPKIAVGESTSIGFDIPVVDLTDKKPKDVTPNLPHIPQNGILKLLAYYKYPNKNFPEGREQFSLFMRNNEIIISGGISSNMKNLTIWLLNLDKLEWAKLKINGLIANRYGHTGIIYQNKVFFLGEKQNI